MDTILNPDEYTEVEGRAYLNPQVGLDESTSFIENLRASQGQQNQEIAEQTRMLGTDVPSNLGGLIGGESYFTSRYQTPQTASTIANLRATAQAKALNDVLANEQAMWKKRYQDAYRNYQKRQNTLSTNPNYGGGLGIDTNVGNTEEIELDIYQPGSGQIIPNTNYVSDYQDPNTGKWYQLTSPREIDLIGIKNSLGGSNPKDGQTITSNGRTLRYVAATDSWYEQTNSAGPDTYSPRAR